MDSAARWGDGLYTLQIPSGLKAVHCESSNGQSEKRALLISNKHVARTTDVGSATISDRCVIQQHASDRCVCNNNTSLECCTAAVVYRYTPPAKSQCSLQGFLVPKERWRNQRFTSSQQLRQISRPCKTVRKVTDVKVVLRNKLTSTFVRASHNFFFKINREKTSCFAFKV